MVRFPISDDLDVNGKQCYIFKETPSLHVVSMPRQQNQSVLFLGLVKDGSKALPDIIWRLCSVDALPQSLRPVVIHDRRSLLVI